MPVIESLMTRTFNMSPHGKKNLLKVSSLISSVTRNVDELLLMLMILMHVNGVANNTSNVGVVYVRGLVPYCTYQT